MNARDKPVLQTPPSGFASLRDVECLRTLVEKLGEGIYVANARGEILDANPAFLAMLGVRELHELSSFGLSDMIADPAMRMRELDLLDRDGAVREFELQIVRPDGGLRTVLDTSYECRDPATGELFYHGMLRDISERKRQEEALREQSIRDPLTGCFNRRYLSEIERRLTGPETTWACIFIDIDHFKHYNDEHGHQMGDHTLIRMSRFLMRQVRAEEAVVRVGGDEFLIVLEGAEEAHAEMVARRLQVAAFRTAPVPFSLGYASREAGESFQRTMHRADQKLLAVRVVDRAPERVREMES